MDGKIKEARDHISSLDSKREEMVLMEEEILELH